MYRYCYSEFAKALAKAAIRPNQIMLPLANYLIGFLMEESNVSKETDCEPYPEIDSKTASRWFNGEKQIPKAIQKAAEDGSYYNDAKKSLFMFIQEHLYENRLESICNELYVPLNEIPTLSSKQKETIKKAFDDKNYLDFLTNALLVALTQENQIKGKVEKRKVKSIKEEITLIEYIMNEYHKPVVILVPEHSTSNEINYVQALLEAYASDARVSFISEEDLKSKEEYNEYRINFDKERKAYYQAESLREATRDSEVFRDDNISFEGFKKEIENGIHETYKATYENGYKRLFAVTDKAVTIPLSSLLATKLKWANKEIKRGTVHIIINDEGEGWVSEHDGE